MIKQIKKHSLILIVTSMLIGCGGGGGSSSNETTVDGDKVNNYTVGETFIISKGQTLTSLVKGTTFNIESNPATGISTITVTKGSVTIQ